MWLALLALCGSNKSSAFPGAALSRAAASGRLDGAAGYYRVQHNHVVRTSQT